MEIKKIPLGKTVKSKKTNYLTIPKNLPESKSNLFLLGKQGVGKSNLLSLLIFFGYKLYLETNAEFGFIPIIFSPLFEYTKLKNPSIVKHSAILPPNHLPQGINALHFSFRMANIPNYLKNEVNEIKLNFRDLNTEDIAMFAGLSGSDDALGKIEKLLENLKKINPHYTIDDFLARCKPDKAVYNSLYYIFKRLNENGLFDERLEEFDWLKALQQRKPICFNYGDIDDENIYQATAGILLRKLFVLSNEYINAVYKQKRQATNPNLKLTKKEKWFIHNFVVGLFFEEAHQFFPPTTTNVLRSFPAHKIYKKISKALGRKRNFKFNFLVSQNLDLIYHGFRQDFDHIFLGSKIDANDKTALVNLFKKIIPSGVQCHKFVSALCANGKFEFSLTNMNELNNAVNNLQSEEPPISQFKAFLSPCAQ